MVSAGIGIGILPGLVATRDLSLKLKPFSTKGPVFHDRIFLTYRRDLQRGKSAQTLIAAIKDAFRSKND